MEHSLPDPLLGQLLDGRYRILGLIEEGPESILYRAESVRLAREVAVEVLNPDSAADEAARSQFERNGRDTALGATAGQAQIFDVGEVDGRPYIARELPPAQPVKDVRTALMPFGKAPTTALEVPPAGAAPGNDIPTQPWAANQAGPAPKALPDTQPQTEKEITFRGATTPMPMAPAEPPATVRVQHSKARRAFAIPIALTVLVALGLGFGYFYLTGGLGTGAGESEQPAFPEAQTAGPSAQAGEASEVEATSTAAETQPSEAAIAPEDDPLNPITGGESQLCQYLWEGEILRVSANCDMTWVGGKTLPQAIYVSGGETVLDFSGYPFEKNTTITLYSVIGQTTVVLPPELNAKLKWTGATGT
ncbi:MAG: hypothetical protein LBQ92_00320, partial [Propionibacteriaceae bacterium]|nr:hypothetical protein [Propionibacteriaceae bacterium]